MTTEEARAVAEVAKTTGEIVHAAGGLGSYLAQVVGSIPEDLLGVMGGDWLKHTRQRQLGKLEANTTRLLGAVGQDRITEPRPSVLIPLLQAAVNETSTELQDLWAALLANAMVDGGNRVRRDYFEAVRQMEPADAVVLNILARPREPSAADLISSAADRLAVYLQQERARLSMSSDDLAISQQKLLKLECLAPNQMGGLPIVLTPFGRGLVAACSPP